MHRDNRCLRLEKSARVSLLMRPGLTTESLNGPGCRIWFHGLLAPDNPAFVANLPSAAPLSKRPRRASRLAWEAAGQRLQASHNQRAHRNQPVSADTRGVVHRPGPAGRVPLVGWPGLDLSSRGWRSNLILAAFGLLLGVVFGTCMLAAFRPIGWCKGPARHPLRSSPVP